jgi:hypothetical protein
MARRLSTSKSSLCVMLYTSINVQEDVTNILMLCFLGAKMEDLARKLLNVRKCEFEPHHKSNLANEFYCYANYDISVDFK